MQAAAVAPVAQSAEDWAAPAAEQERIR